MIVYNDDDAVQTMSMRHVNSGDRTKAKTKAVYCALYDSVVISILSSETCQARLADSWESPAGDRADGESSGDDGNHIAGSVDEAVFDVCCPNSLSEVFRLIGRRFLFQSNHGPIGHSANQSIVEVVDSWDHCLPK